jgi:hypothetical protein
MLSGECRIDAIPIHGQAVLIDGLRLRLDLRLAPSAKATDSKQRTGSLLLPRRVQRLAAMAGLAALLSALALWFAGGGAPAPQPAPPATAAPPVPAPTARAVAAPPPVEVTTPVAPEVRPIVPPATRSESPTASAAKPALAVAKSPAPSRPAPKPPAGRPPATDREMLDLFGDTK